MDSEPLWLLWWWGSERRQTSKWHQQNNSSDHSKNHVFELFFNDTDLKLVTNGDEGITAPRCRCRLLQSPLTTSLSCRAGPPPGRAFNGRFLMLWTRRNTKGAAAPRALFIPHTLLSLSLSLPWVSWCDVDHYFRTAFEWFTSFASRLFSRSEFVVYKCCIHDNLSSRAFSMDVNNSTYIIKLRGKARSLWIKVWVCEAAGREELAREA